MFVGRGSAARETCGSIAMLTFVFAVWSVARALGWACDPVPTTPDAEEVPVLPRLRSARASSDLSTLSATTTSSSQTSSGEYSKRSKPLIQLLFLNYIAFTFIENDLSIRVVTIFLFTIYP